MPRPVLEAIMYSSFLLSGATLAVGGFTVSDILLSISMICGGLWFLVRAVLGISKERAEVIHTLKALNSTLKTVSANQDSLNLALHGQDKRVQKIELHLGLKD
jgi:hypothetical protein